MAGAYDLDYSGVLGGTPQTGASRGMAHLGTVLDAIMERKSREEAEKARLAQAAAIAAEDDKRQRDQLNWTIKHQGTEEDLKRQELDQADQDKTAKRAMEAMPHFDAAKESGDIEGMKQWAGPGGIAVQEHPQTPAMDLLGALTDKPAPADPLGTPPPMGYTPMGEIQAPPGVVPPAEPPASPSLLEAQLAAPKPPTYDVTVPGGAPTVYDPAAARTRRMEQGAQLAQDLAGIAGDSPFDKRAQADVQRMANSGAIKTRDQVLQEYIKQKNFYELQAEENKRNAVSAAGKVAAFAKPDTGRRLDLNSLRADFKDWKNTSQFAKLQQGGFALRGAAANLEADGPNAALQHKDAQIQLAKYFRGNVPTDSEMHMLYENLGGTLGNGLPKFFAKMETGDLTPTELNMLKESMSTAHEEYARNVKMAYESARANFGPGSGYENLATNVNTHIRGAFKNMGIPLEDLGGDIYPEATTGVTLKGGAGAKPRKAVGGGVDVDALTDELGRR